MLVTSFLSGASPPKKNPGSAPEIDFLHFGLSLLTNKLSLLTL